MYNIKILKIREDAEWWNPEMSAKGAGPMVEGSVLKRRVTCEVSNGVTVLNTIELLADEPFTAEGFDKAVKEYVSELPLRHPDEGRLEARVDDVGTVEIYRDDVKVALKEAEEPIIKK
jgi:hypothetical protein